MISGRVTPQKKPRESNEPSGSGKKGTGRAYGREVTLLSRALVVDVSALWPFLGLFVLRHPRLLVRGLPCVVQHLTCLVKMQFDDYGNVVAREEIEVGQRSPVSEAVSRRFPRNDRVTSRFLSMNGACAQFADPPNLVKEPTDIQEDDSVVLTEKDWLSFVTCSISMLQSRDQICRFADDVLGFGDLKLSGTHTGGYIISDGLLSDLLDLLAEDHWEKQKKKNPKARKKKKPTPAKDVDKDTIFCDFGTKTDYFRVRWLTLRYLMKWEEGGWLSSTCVDFLAELVNLSLGHAPNENVYPPSLMANSFTGWGLVPQYGDEDRIPLMTDRFTPDFEDNFVRCVRKVWFPNVKTNVKKSLYCYKAVDIPMPKIAFSVNCHGNHWETLCVDPKTRHVFSLDPYPFRS